MSFRADKPLSWIELCNVAFIWTFPLEKTSWLPVHPIRSHLHFCWAVNYWRTLKDKAWEGSPGSPPPHLPAAGALWGGSGTLWIHRTFQADTQTDRWDCCGHTLLLTPAHTRSHTHTHTPVSHHPSCQRLMNTQGSSSDIPTEGSGFHMGNQTMIHGILKR